MKTKKEVEDRIKELNEYYPTLKSSKAQRGVIAQVGALKWVLGTYG